MKVKQPLILLVLAAMQWNLSEATHNIQLVEPARLRAYRIRMTDESRDESTDGTLLQEGEEAEESTDGIAQPREESEESTSATATFPHLETATATCKGRDFNITVTGKRCASKVVKSKFCYGLCSSFYVPGRRGAASQMSECCRPTETVMETVELECMRKGNKGMRIKKVEVERVLACGCQRAD